MRRSFPFLTALLIAHCLSCNRTTAQTGRELPVGKLAFITAEQGFGSPGEIVIQTGSEQVVTKAFKTGGRFSVDGRRIFYDASDFRRSGFHEYDLASQENTQLLTNMPKAEAPSLSPDGKHLAFVVYSTDRKKSHIHTAQLDGTKMVQLTKGDHYDWNPQWSPDGKRIVFETTRNDGPENHEMNGGYRDIYVMDAGGNNQLNLTEGTYGHSPAWSPDGGKIAYMAKRGIWVMNADGSEKRNVSASTTRDSEPAWSPDGQWIAFTRTASPTGGAMDIWIMRNDGTEQRQITFNKGDAASHAPSWFK